MSEDLAQESLQSTSHSSAGEETLDSSDRSPETRFVELQVEGSGDEAMTEEEEEAGDSDRGGGGGGGRGSGSKKNFGSGDRDNEGSSLWDQEGGGEEEDLEDLELLEELRELYKGINSSLCINLSSESMNSSMMNSSMNDDPEHLKRKVERLQRSVQEWKESYDQLMRELRKLNLERVEEREELVKVVKVHSDNAENLERKIRGLKGELAECQKLFERADSMNQYLLKEANSLRKERGMKEVELSILMEEVDTLRISELEQSPKQQLEKLLKLLDRGIKEGTLKLSELDFSNLPKKDFDVGCGCGPLLGSYKEDLEHVRAELKGRAQELEGVREVLASLQNEHQQTLQDLQGNCHKLHQALQEKATLKEELCEEKRAKDLLKEEVRSLEDELKASQLRERSLDDSLLSTNDSLRHVEELTQQRVELKERELAQVRAELGELEGRHGQLEQAVLESRLRVDQLERSERNAQLECEELRQELEEWRAKERQIEMVAGEKDRLQRKLHGLMAELESQVKLAEQYKGSLDALQGLHCKSQDEAGKVRAQLLSKETDLSRVLTTLQLTASQLSALRRRGKSLSPTSSPKTSPTSSPKSPRMLTRELSECESLVEEVEQELRAHSKQWETLHASTLRDNAAIAQLAACKEELEKELQENGHTVKHLEGLLQEVGESYQQLQGEYEQRMQSLVEELEVTRSDYQAICQENMDLKDELGSLDGQQQLLVLELEKRSETLLQNQSREEELKQEYQACLQRYEAAEGAKKTLEIEQRRVLAELREKEQLVQELERLVSQERRGRAEEVRGLEKQLAQEQESQRQQEEASSQQISSLREDLRAKLGFYEDEHLRYLEVEELLKEKVLTLESLEAKKRLLEQQYAHTQSEVEHSQQLVETLQEDLASSHGQCDGLQQAVSQFEKKLEAMSVDMSQQLQANMDDKMTLQDKVVSLQSELELSVTRYQFLQQEKIDAINGAHQRVLEAEKSHTDILQRLGQLEQCLREEREKEREEHILRGLMEAKEEQLEVALHTHREKEQSWQGELFRLSSELELSQQQVSRLEKGVTASEERVDVLRDELQDSQRREDLANQEMTSGQQFEVALKRQLEEKRAQVLELESSMANFRGELATLKGQLAASEDGRLRLQQRMAESEEEHSHLLQCHFEAEQELHSLEQNLDDTEEQKKQLQEDCKSLTEKISSISQGERSSNDMLIQRIRELDGQLVSLKAANDDLELRNDMLSQSNAGLKAQISSITIPPEEVPLGSNDSTTSNDGGGGGGGEGGGSALSLSVNVVTNIPATTSAISTGTSTVGVASATVPLRLFESQYRRSMESGLQVPSLDFPGSETESEAALDKEYWVQRAGELSVQLQQSSEYWAQKVRELSIDLEKQRQVRQHVD